MSQHQLLQQKNSMVFVLSCVGFTGALCGLVVGSANDDPLTGGGAGLAIAVSIAFIAMYFSGNFSGRPSAAPAPATAMPSTAIAPPAPATSPRPIERFMRLSITLLYILLGFLIGGIALSLVGLCFGYFMGWFIYWLYYGRYRDHLLPYLTSSQVCFHYAFRILCGLIFIFLISPILVVMPLSFNAQNFFTFTKEMLALDPAGYSLKHYADFFWYSC